MRTEFAWRMIIDMTAVGDSATRTREEIERCLLLRYVQPGLLGLIDGTLSTLAPVFAAAFLIGSHAALVVGLATALGAGISMALSEALSDNGEETNRGRASARGLVTGVMTAVGGILHALPFLIHDQTTAITLAGIVVAIELTTIAILRRRFLKMPLPSSILQVVVGGIVIVAVGVALGVS